MTKVLIAGDWHGNVHAAERAFYYAEDYDCVSILHVGDFGYWEHVDKGVHYLNALQIFSEDAGVDLFFADGNHEWHDGLMALQPNKNGIRFCRPSIKHVRRGSMIEVGGRKIQFFGGAWSINNPRDKIWKRHPQFVQTVEGVNWWPGEEPSHDDVEHASQEISRLGQPDILITHDAPYSLGSSVLPSNDALDGEVFPQSDLCRQRIESVFLASDPSLLIHGHYHHHYVRVMEWGARVVGMGVEDRKNALMLLDLDTLTFDMI